LAEGATDGEEQMRWIVVCAALALGGCSVTAPVAIVTSRGETLKGSATSDLFAGGSFEAENARVRCTGKYDISSGSRTVSIAARCTDGSSGVGRAIRDTATSGSGKIQMNDGTEAMFVFGAAADAI
jgi:hypothetical protein